MAADLRIDMDGLYIAVGRMLEGYSAEISAELDEAADKISKEALQAVRAASPVHRGEITRKGKRRAPGTYKKGWKRKRMQGRYVIYNTQPGLTHLLEHGHAKKNGGRTRPYPHIEANAEIAARKFEEQAKQILGEIG